MMMKSSCYYFHSLFVNIIALTLCIDRGIKEFMYVCIYECVFAFNKYYVYIKPLDDVY